MGSLIRATLFYCPLLKKMPFWVQFGFNWVHSVSEELATRIGEILLSIPKQTGNQYTSASSERLEKAKSKSETTEQMGYTRHEVSDYQRMAQNQAEKNHNVKKDL